MPNIFFKTHTHTDRETQTDTHTHTHTYIHTVYIYILYYFYRNSCDTEDWSNDAENSAFIITFNYILTDIHIKNGYYKL